MPRNVPRGIPTPAAPEPTPIAAPLQIGSGMVDPNVNPQTMVAQRTEHSPPVMSPHGHSHERAGSSPEELAHFERMRHANDPANIPHDRSFAPDQKVLFEVCSGTILDAVLYPEGAHLMIQDAEGVIHAVFSAAERHVILGQKVVVMSSSTMTGDRIFLSKLPDEEVVEEVLDEGLVEIGEDEIPVTESPEE